MNFVFGLKGKGCERGFGIQTELAIEIQCTDTETGSMECLGIKYKLIKPFFAAKVCQRKMSEKTSHL